MPSWVRFRSGSRQTVTEPNLNGYFLPSIISVPVGKILIMIRGKISVTVQVLICSNCNPYKTDGDMLSDGVLAPLLSQTARP